MPEENERAISTLRKRSGVTKASITRLTTRLKDLEGDVSRPGNVERATGMRQKLDTLDAEFRTHHQGLVDLIDDEHSLATEQNELDDHDDLIAELTVRVDKLITACSSADGTPRKLAARRLVHAEKSLSDLSAAIHTLKEDPSDTCVLRQYKEQLIDLKGELSDARSGLLPLDLDDSDDLLVQLASLEKGIFDSSVEVKRKLSTSSPPTPLGATLSTSSDQTGVKLPKLDVPTFDGNILNWRSFWEQFRVSVHNRTSISDSEKFVYLQQSLRDGSAKNVIEGHSRSGDNYSEAVECLQARFNRPRLIHQTHVHMIAESPTLKDGSGKELRCLHDTVQQHLCALKAMGHELPGPFITSLLELKLDSDTMFEWQRHSQESTDVPHFSKLLEFLDLRAQASESSAPASHKSSSRSQHRSQHAPRPIATFATNTSDSVVNCVLCGTIKHPLYVCPKFKSLSHDEMVTTLKDNNLCLNCLKPGHYVRNCKSHNRCRICQRTHHSLLHVDSKQKDQTPSQPPPQGPTQSTSRVSSNLATGGLGSNALMMTCWVLVHSPNGSAMKVRALLDSASSASFVSERLTHLLEFPHVHQDVRISGIAGLSHRSPSHSVVQFSVSPLSSPIEQTRISAVVVQRVTCDLPVQPITPQLSWNNISDITLADPDFGRPGRIDLLLGVDVFVTSLLNGRRVGSPGTPTAFETKFGWVLAGSVESQEQPHHISTHQVATHHSTLITGDDLLRKFWEIEEGPGSEIDSSPEEQAVVSHFKENHRRNESGRFIVPLPRRSNAPILGELRSQPVRRLLSLEHSLYSKDEFSTFNDVIQEYFDLGHAESVPVTDLEKSEKEVFYLPMHAVKKESSTTTKIRAVFDASASSSSGASLNDLLLVGPMVHSSLVDVLLRFRLHRVALTTDVSKMYRAIELVPEDRDLHRFVWRQSQDKPLRDFRMTRVTFGVSASSFAANMCVKQNALDFALEYPQAASAVEKSFYVDDGLTGADSMEEAVQLQAQLQELFSKGGFLLRKWNSSETAVLDHIPLELRDVQPDHKIPESEGYSKTLGFQWNSSLDHFRLTIADFPDPDNFTKRQLVSDIAKTFDVLGWFSPSIIKIKILLQRVWELKIGWDEFLPPAIKRNMDTVEISAPPAL